MQNQSQHLPEGAVTVVAFLKAKAGSERAMQEASVTLEREVLAENSGVTIFQAFKGSDVPGIVTFVEVYETRDAFVAHKNSDRLQRWLEAIQPYAADPITVMVLDPLTS